MATQQLVPTPDLAPVRKLVLDAVSSPLTRAIYGHALDAFFTWWETRGRPVFSRSTVQAYRVHLEQQLGLSAATINQRLATEAGYAGLLVRPPLRESVTSAERSARVFVPATGYRRIGPKR